MTNDDVPSSMVNGPSSKLETQRETTPPASAILLVFMVYVAGTTCNWGFLSWWGLALVLGAVALAFWFHVRPQWQGPSSEALLTGILIACLVASCHLVTGQHQQTVKYDSSWRLTGYGIAIKVLMAAALFIALTYLARPRPPVAKSRLVALVLIAIAVRVLVLFSSPMPRVDVFISQTHGAIGLPEGKNVYLMTFPSPYAPNERFSHFGYPPAVVYCNVISWHLFKDVRAAWIICDLLAALLMYLLARRVNPGAEHERLCELLPLTFLFLPRALFVIEQSWTEPLVIVSLAGFALAVAAGRGPALAGGLLGLWLSSKQYVALAVPLLLKLRRWTRWTWIMAAAVALILILPFALWDFSGMMYNVIGFFLKSEGRPDSLSLYGLLKATTNQEIPWWVVAPIWLAGIAWFTWKMPRNLAGMLFATASLWMFFFLFGKQAFMNYFHLVAFTLLLAVAAVPRASEKRGAPREGADVGAA